MENGHINEEQIRLEIKRMIARVTEREPEEVSDDALFKEDLGVDSLMAMELMVAVDRKFKIDIPEEEFTMATNVDQAVVIVQRYLPRPQTATSTI
jgi:acyl carrier protein